MNRGPTSARSSTPRGARPAWQDDTRSAGASAGGATGGLATKGDEIEEWLDLRFFRPIGAQIARHLAPTRVSPDQVTLLSLIIGLGAGHLFVYASPRLNAAGFVLFIVSDLFDSADGQLARIRGTSTRFGRMLDGLSDAARFINLGLHLLVRLAVVGGWSWPAAAVLVLVAGTSHSMQSGAIDFVRHAYLALAVGRGSELDVDAAPATLSPPESAPWFRRLAAWVYRGYVRRQASMFPHTVALLRAQREHRLAPGAAAVYRQRVTPLVRHCVWLGQNLRFIILGATAVAGWPSGLLWVTALPMNVVLYWLVSAQERHATRVLRAEAAGPPASPTPSVIVLGGE